MVIFAVLAFALHLVSFAVVHAADPNIIVPAIIAAIPVTIAAVAGMLVTMNSIRRGREKQDKTVNDAAQQVLEAITGVHEEVSTNHGLRAGEYIEMIGPMSDFLVQHAKDDNEIRRELGLTPGKVPTWRRRNGA